MQSQTANTLKSELNSAASKGQKAAKSMTSSLSSDISEQIDDLVERAQDVVKTYEPRVRAASESTVDFVRRHPVACAAGALVLGYAIVAFSRRNRE